jgi:uncharacterized protein (DUF433 family)
MVEPEARVYEHIVLRNREPIIFGTRYSVLHLVEERLAYGWSAEELHLQHPDLGLGQIYAALAYYADHQPEVDRLIEQRWADFKRRRDEAGDSPLRQKLRAAGRLA